MAESKGVDVTETNSVDSQISSKIYEPTDVENPEVARKYYPTVNWENFKAFDPYFRWTNYEDRQATRQTDLKIFSVVALLFFALNLDRGNLSSAVAGGLLVDLEMTTNDYNLGNNLRSIGFIISEIPSQLIGKRFGPDWWIPLQVIAWSIVSIFQFFINGKRSYWALRFLLGLAQGGFIADAVQYLSYFYTRDQMGIRLALFWVTDSYSGIISNLLAIAFLKIDLNGVESWKWLFLFDGIITLALGILSFFIMVPGPTQTKTRFIPKGLFTEKQEKIIANRLLRDDPSKSDMHNREAVTVKQFFKTLSDYDLWPLLILSLVFEIPQNPIKAYLNINLKALNFTTDQIIYLNIPIEVFVGITLIAITSLSEWLNERALVSLLPQIWLLIFIIIEYTSVEKLSPWSQYAIEFFVLSTPSAQAIIVSWCSRVSYSVRARAISAPMSNIGIQLAGIIGNNIYRADDAPYYKRGNRVLIGIAAMNIVLFILTKLYYIWRNKTKREKWNSFTEEEKEDYLAKHHDDGNKRLDYLFEH
ncbi:MFS general substrate transporter [Yamadazyma tenuis ATCC 10573]|uniref:MFS general substrate transporter n=1 Tax=Candida tenuis (strain ATCC 10573 / BCRC 21748 / CBS 615 / JCM 9827 / NBRC 10315 / NRRL Y-1498 / VKM Y-70) TaxID=590646 RepID=G3AX97_CANTC|nr:MFS general substrate transporter [Yamadazyma tenuis ATCC 10573]EGV66725.1 MFS general substrate transporter [Yamadazyma tenuis ATCC 10573]